MPLAMAALSFSRSARVGAGTGIGPGDQPGHVAPSVARQLEDRRIGPGLAQLSGGAPIVAHDNLATGIGFAPMQQTGEL